MRFDRVLTNPPFSQNYNEGLPHPERFPYGWCPTSGKKADPMFVQHMVSVLRAGGMVCTVMPHGVLFRGGAERDIRAGFIKGDLLEAVIGLAPNLFYGAGIPACILVLRAKGSKPAERRGKVLFINADAEYRAGRAQNDLDPEHIEKVVSAFRRGEDIPGFAAVVTHEDLKANDYNLNIRRYADNAPPPEPHDVRAHLDAVHGVAGLADEQRPLVFIADADLQGGDHLVGEHDQVSEVGAGESSGVLVHGVVLHPGEGDRTISTGHPGAPVAQLRFIRLSPFLYPSGVELGRSGT